MNKKIGIVAIGYNRPKSLRRLLHFLNRAHYCRTDITLIISLDYYEDDCVRTLAEAFAWEHGEKILRFYETNLGLREHVLRCGNYVNAYDLDAVIVFEDDIVPAWDFFQYAERAIEAFAEDAQVAGIALYSHRLNPNAGKPFEPARSRFDNFFMQFACSWGQVWTRTQWNAFYAWYLERKETAFDAAEVPAVVCSWPASSWLKHHIRYCAEKKLYFVYPYTALATNFNEAGTHVLRTVNDYQIPILEGEKKEYCFGGVAEAVKYDAFFERIGMGELLGVEEAQLCVDLYAEQPEHGRRRYWLTTAREDYRILGQWGNSFRVTEENIRYGIPGNAINLYDTMETCENIWNDTAQLVKEAGITEEKKGIVLAGAGEYGRRWLEKLHREGMGVLCFADRDKKKIGGSFCGKPVLCYRELKGIRDRIRIFITVSNPAVREEIEAMLTELGLTEQIVENLYSASGGGKIDPGSYIKNSYLEGDNLLLNGTQLIDSRLGRYSYLSANARILHARVGRYTCIGPDVTIITGQHPTSGMVSMHPAFYSRDNAIGYSFVRENKFTETRTADGEYAVVIGNDVWIGMGARIMEGVTIADGSVIAAGAVVVKDTRPYEVVGGVPARHIRYRFEEEERNRLLQIEWWKKERAWILEHAEEFEDIRQFCRYEMERNG